MALVRQDHLPEILQMYSYYGAVSWQILGLSLAAAFVLATAPFLVVAEYIKQPILTQEIITAFGIGSSILAFLMVGMGVVFWNRSQNLAYRWVVFGESCFRNYLLNPVNVPNYNEVIRYIENQPIGRQLSYRQSLVYLVMILALLYVAGTAILFWFMR